MRDLASDLEGWLLERGAERPRTGDPAPLSSAEQARLGAYRPLLTRYFGVRCPLPKES